MRRWGQYGIGSLPATRPNFLDLKTQLYGAVKLPGTIQRRPNDQLADYVDDKSNFNAPIQIPNQTQGISIQLPRQFYQFSLTLHAQLFNTTHHGVRVEQAKVALTHYHPSYITSPFRLTT